MKTLTYNFMGLGSMLVSIVGVALAKGGHSIGIGLAVFAAVFSTAMTIKYFRARKKT